MRFFGVYGDLLSVITLLAALALCYLIGLSASRKGLLVVWIVVGLAANIVSQVVFAEGGPGACAGMCAFPLLCVVFGYAGKAMRLRLHLRKAPIATCQACGFAIRDDNIRRCPACRRLVRCTSCGYDLTGNVSGVCPECGLRIPGDIEEEGNRC